MGRKIDFICPFLENDFLVEAELDDGAGIRNLEVSMAFIPPPPVVDDGEFYVGITDVMLDGLYVMATKTGHRDNTLRVYFELAAVQWAEENPPEVGD